MARCGDCIHYDICDPYVCPDENFPEVNGCKCFKDKTEFIRRSEAVIEVLSDLKKEVHKKAVYPGIQDVMPYVPLKDIDGIIVKMANMLYEEGKHRES